MTIRTRSFDYQLTTAEILYHLPDHPGILQSYVWQNLDIAPRYPALHRFLDFWQAKIEGPLHSVRVASHPIGHRPGLRAANLVLRLH